MLGLSWAAISSQGGGGGFPNSLGNGRQAALYRLNKLFASDVDNQNGFDLLLPCFA